HPSQWLEYYARADAIRTREIVRAGADPVLAFPVGALPGPRVCVTGALKAGLSVRLIEGQSHVTSLKRTARRCRGGSVGWPTRFRRPAAGVRGLLLLHLSAPVRGRPARPARPNHQHPAVRPAGPRRPRAGGA